MTLSAGDWVEVRSKDEILATLDENGRLDGLPFMPQLFKWCGQRFQVHKRAHKTCDTVSGYSSGQWLGRRLPNAVHLDLRCDGEAYGGCQAACLIFWKEAWLKPVDPSRSASAEPDQIPIIKSRGCTERAVLDATRSSDQPPGKGIRYACQATELPGYTQPLKWWDARQYAEDLVSGNVSLSKMCRSFLYFAFVCVTMARRRKLGRPARWIYDRIQSLWEVYPFRDEVETWTTTRMPRSLISDFSRATWFEYGHTRKSWRRSTSEPTIAEWVLTPRWFHTAERYSGFEPAWRNSSMSALATSDA